MDHRELAQKIYNLINLYLAEDHEKALDILREIGTGADVRRTYLLCSGIAAGAKKALEHLTGPDCAYIIEQLKEGALDDPAEAFAVRFIVAYANDDTHTASALHLAAFHATPEQFEDSVLALLKNAVGLIRLALEKEPTA